MLLTSLKTMLSFNNFTEQETELISYYLKHNISLFELSIKFNISEHKTKNILKTFNHINHTSNYKIKIFRKFDHATCRTEDLFMTDAYYNPLNNYTRLRQKTKVVSKEELFNGN